MNIQVKYDSLPPEAQKQVEAFLEFVRSQTIKRGNTGFDMKLWKSKIKDIPQWSEEDLSVFAENKDLFNQWTIPKW